MSSHAGNLAQQDDIIAREHYRTGFLFGGILGFAVGIAFTSMFIGFIAFAFWR